MKEIPELADKIRGAGGVKVCYGSDERVLSPMQQAWIADALVAYEKARTTRPEAPRSEEAAVLAAAKRLAHYLEEGWDEQDDPADVAEADGACDGLVKAVKALLCAPSPLARREERCPHGVWKADHCWSCNPVKQDSELPEGPLP